MAFDAHKNFAVGVVATAPSPAGSGTSLVLGPGQGALFPAAPFNAVIWPANTVPLSTSAEIARVTAKATDTLTLTRAQEGSAARTILVGDQIAAAVTAKTLTDLEDILTGVTAGSVLRLTTALAVGTDPATAGGVQLANGLASGVYARNFANLADIHLISLNGSDIIELGNGGQTILVGGTVSAGGGLQAGASNIIGWAGFTRMVSSADAKMQLWNNALTAGVGLDFATNGTLKVRTTAQNADATLSALLLQTMTALVALGGGAAPTFGTIGGSGPATAAQNTWLRMLDSAGVAFWVPAWK